MCLGGKREELTRAVCYPLRPDRTLAKVIKRLLCNICDIRTHSAQCAGHRVITSVQKCVSTGESEKHGTCLVSSKAARGTSV